MTANLSPEQQQALDRTRPIALCAGAGSGKTRVLIERYLRAIEDVGFDLDAVLAVTFTRKATAEMLGRVRAEITARMDAGGPHAAAWRQVRERLGSAWILTIDAFCHRILGEMGPAAGLAAERRILTGGALAEVLHEAVRDVVDRVAETPADPDHETLRLLLGAWSRKKLVGHLGMLIERRSRAEPWARDLLAEPAGGADRLAAEVARLRGAPPSGAAEPDREQHLLQAALARIFLRLLARYRALLASAGACDFRQLLEDVADAFQDERVRKTWAARFRHVLVDEFQDTDPIQWKVLRSLFGTDRIERPGLFVVGDEKQAIFSFRDGDVFTFQEAAREIVDAGGRRLTLAENYRSTPRLVCFFNRISETSFSRDGHDGGAEHAAMAPVRDRETPGAPAVASQIEILVGRGEDGAAARRSELHAVAARIRRFVETGTLVFDKDAKAARPATYDDQAVLLRTRLHLEDLETVLLERGIPFRVLGGIGFYDQHEIRALVNLMRFLSDSQDDLALLGVLRSAFFAIPDSVLLAAVVVSRAKPKQPLWRKILRLRDGVRSGEASLPTPGDFPVLADAVDRLERYRRLADRLPSNDLLALAVRESDLALTLDAVDPSGRAGKNVEKLLDTARRCRGEGLSALEDLDRTIALARAGASDSPEAQADPPSAGRPGVSVLTVHAAKGLEWPIVFVPGTDAKAVRAGGDDAGPVRLRGDAAIPFLHEVRAENWDKREKSPLHDAIKKLGEKERVDEARRLLYVAATRARDHLVLSASLADGKEATEDSWLAWAVAAKDESIPLIGCREAGDGGEASEASVPARLDTIRVGEGPVPAAAPAALAGTGADLVVSATALARLRACPRRYFLEQIVGIDGEWRGGEVVAAEDAVPAATRGSIVHGALEGIASGVDPVSRVAAVAARFGISGAAAIAPLEEHVRKALTGFRAWPIGRAILEAPAGAVRSEVGFELRDPGSAGRGCRLAGAIDLLHELPSGGAVIVDFKTDRARGDLRRLAAESGYVDQLEAYAAAILRARGGPVKAWLFFTESGKAVPVVGEGGTPSAESCLERIGCTLTSLDGLAAAGFPLTPEPEICASCPHRGKSCPGALGAK